MRDYASSKRTQAHSASTRIVGRSGTATCASRLSAGCADMARDRRHHAAMDHPARTTQQQHHSHCQSRSRIQRLAQHGLGQAANETPQTPSSPKATTATMPLAACKLCGMTADSRNLDKHHPHRRSKHTIDITIPLCRKCHSYVENNVEFARKQGFLSYHELTERERRYHEE